MLVFLSEVAITPAGVSYVITRLLIGAFSDVENPFTFRLGGFPPNQKIKQAFQCQRRLGFIGCLAYMKLTCTIALVN